VAPRRHVVWPLLTAAALVLILVVAAVLRLTGRDWDGLHHLHPDERFLTMVTISLEPVEGLAQYLDTSSSTLNPKNVGDHPDYVYGTFPVILVRLLGELTGHRGYDQVHLLGRALSAACDLGVVLLVFLIGWWCCDRRVGLLAAAFSALSVLQIQQSHFFTVDNFSNLLVTCALYLAVRLAWPRTGGDHGALRPLLGPCALFGLAAGAAIAAKLAAAPVVVLLPLALAARLSLLDPSQRAAAALRAFVALLAAAASSLLAFRLLQPYAFVGPGLFDLALNPRWVDSIRNLMALSGPQADWPPALQWARRSVGFAAKNMVLWGLGPALGGLAWGSFLAAAWPMLRGRWQRFAPLWLWLALYFGWQSLVSNPTMRYLLPVYPALAVFAAWAVVGLWDLGTSGRRGWRVAAVAAGAGTLVVTALWATAFVSIYTRPVTRVAASRWLLDHAPGPLTLRLATAQGLLQQPLLVPYGFEITPQRPLRTRLAVARNGVLHSLLLPHAHARPDDGGPDASVAFTVSLRRPEQTAAAAVLAAHCPPGNEVRGQRVVLALEHGLAMRTGEEWEVEVAVASGSLLLEGAAVVNESSWDDGLPLRLPGSEPFAGHLQPGLSLELYWPDDELKLERFENLLGRADYLVISSSRQWASLTRLPERYPLTTAYYRELLGCPRERSVEACYEVAQPGTSAGTLGFDLVAVFESPPTLGPLRINDQAAEEAFTVYDHPKVFVFARDRDRETPPVRQVLGGIDLERVVHLVPGAAGRYPADLMLPRDRLLRQRAGGTWSALFDRSSPVNAWPLLTVVLWYLVLSALGTVALPLVRLALPGLADRGQPLARVVGLLLVAWLVWLAGSLGASFDRTTISLALAALSLAGGAAAWYQRRALLEEWRERRARILTAELLFLGLLALGLAVRLANPDLWHPSKGGEKPMDLAYLTAVLRSSTFPPYDPWFAGGYVNYYYWGFVLVGVPVKLLGIVPATAYNLLLPTLFALTGCAAYSVGANLSAARAGRDPLRPAAPVSGGGLAAAAAMTLLGNLATAPMIVDGLRRLGTVDVGPGGVGGMLLAIVRGTGRAVAGAPLPFHLGDWYWNPTRIIPDPEVGPITEFPCFTFLYGDLHAHLLEMPLLLLVIAWTTSVVSRWRLWREPRGLLKAVPAVLLGALAVGALRVTNTWSFYPFLALATAGLGWSLWRGLDRLPAPGLRVFAAATGSALLVALAHWLFWPFDRWYGAGYSRLDLWSGGTTPLGAYLTHWGLFLLVLATWLACELGSWIREGGRPARRWLLGATMATVAGLLVLLPLGVTCAWVALPLAAAAFALIARSEQPESTRLALALTGSGMLLTLLVEVVVLRGDIGRMNTVFKFYLQAWTLLAMAAAAALGPTLGWVAQWSRRWPRAAWRSLLAMLLAAVALYPLCAGMAKMRDRMCPDAPHSLDGSRFLACAVDHDQGTAIPLSEDLAAIHWLQEHVAGSPVIVEANTPEYRWGSRVSVHTGLPSVVGWSWHERQQRALVPAEWITDRIQAVHDFYRTEDPQAAAAFLASYDVAYVIVGGLERAYYPGPGLAKFAALDGQLWQSVFQAGETTIYQVQ